MSGKFRIYEYYVLIYSTVDSRNGMTMDKQFQFQAYLLRTNRTGYGMQ